ncbi:hypothetical protein C8Q76DRAFT_635549, partial [Earliella scabrosa]
MSFTSTSLATLSTTLGSLGLTTTELFVGLIDANLTYPYHTLSIDLVSLLDCLDRNESTHETTRRWACNLVQRTCRDEILALAHPTTGLRFNASHASQDQLEEFDMANLAKKYCTLAPTTWALMAELETTSEHEEVEPEQGMEEAEEDAEGEGEGGEQEGEVDGDLYDEEDEYEASTRRKGVIAMKSVVIISIAVQSTNQRCNALQSTVGVYLHACRASESIIELLSRIGISISRASIDSAVKSLWKEAHINVKELARTLLGAWAFDNFDVEIKHLVPTAERPQDALLHLTSGTLLRLDHGVTPADLRCSEELWKGSRLNPDNTGTSIPSPDWMQLLNLHPDVPDASGLTRRDRFNQWKFLSDLVHYGPEYFRDFIEQLGEPEAMEKIPVVKSHQVPLEGMDINQSTAQGNADALAHMFKQGGIGDPA